MAQKAPQKVALVTGAGGGIGKALVLEFHRRGYKVYATDLKFTPGRQAQFESEGITCLLLDVTSEENVAKVSTHIALDNDRKIDFLYCNAGRIEAGLAADVTDEQIRSLYELNLFANMRLVRHFVRPLINGKGTIAFSGSVTKDLPFLGNCLYSSSKAALDQYAFVLHTELRNYGVKVIDVIGGYIKTPIFDSPTTKIPHGSVYDFSEFVVLYNQRKAKLQNSASMSPDVFARRTLDKIEKADINTFRLYEGYRSGTISLFCRWIPSKKLVDHILKIFNMDFDYREHLKNDRV